MHQFLDPTDLNPLYGRLDATDSQIAGILIRLGVQDSGMPDPGFVDFTSYRLRPDSPYAGFGASLS